MADVFDFLTLFDDPPPKADPDPMGLKGNPRIMGRAKVAPGVIVTDDAKIGGYAVIHGGVFKGNARIGGFAIIHGGEWDGVEGPVYDGEWDGPGKPAMPKHSAKNRRDQ